MSSVDEEGEMDILIQLYSVSCLIERAGVTSRINYVALKHNYVALI